MTAIATASTVDLTQLKAEIQVTEDDVQQWGLEEEEKKEVDEEEEVADQILVQSPPPVTPGSDDQESYTPDMRQLSENESSPVSPRQLPSSAIEPLNQPIDLTDEEFWENVTEREMPLRFSEFRQEAVRQISELRAVASQSSSNEDLHFKHREDKKKWKNEKATLMGHIQQLQRLQEEAEIDANEAMKQLETLAAEHEEVQRKLADANVRQVSSSENINGESQKSNREQGTSPDIPNPLSAESRKSVADLVEEKKAAMKKRMANASSLITKDNKTPASSSVDVEAFENFSKSYKSILQFKKHIADILSHAPQSQQAAKKLVGTPDHVIIPEENETDSMVQNVESVLNSVESALRSFIKESASTGIPNSVNTDNELRGKIAQLQTEIQSMRHEYEQRAHADAEAIHQLQIALSNVKHDNIPSNMQITTNTPSAPAPVNAEHLLTLSQGNITRSPDRNMTMMFTRLDSEHNTKALLNATKTGKINQATLESLVVTMDAYNDVAAIRLQQLVRKIVHHTKMKEIEINVRNSNLVTSEVFDVLEKMEELQRRRAHKFSQEMDELNSKRNRLGLLLQDAMQRLEKITGVFLIKPIISYPGNAKSRKYSGKISTKFNVYQMEAMAAKERNKKMETDYATVPMKSSRYSLPSQGVPWTAQSVPPIATKEDREDLTISGLTRVNPPMVWSPGISLPQTVPLTKTDQWLSGNPLLSSSMPKLVELDVGRFLHEINPIHTFTSSQKNSPRVIPGSSRTYTGIPRIMPKPAKTAMKLGSGRRSQSEEKQHEANGVKPESVTDDYQSTAPPTTPASQTHVRHGSSGLGLMTPSSDVPPFGTPNLPRPLPPIQVPSRSQASTRSSFTASPLKDHSTPSPTKSPLEDISSPRAKGTDDSVFINEEGIGDGTHALPLKPYVEAAN